MRPIPQKLKQEMEADPFYKQCARKPDGNCKGRITWEHAIIYAGKQLNEKWAIIPLCAYHHAVDEYQDCGDLWKERNQWIAINRATNEELEKISKVVDYKFFKNKLNQLNGDYAKYRKSYTKSSH